MANATNKKTRQRVNSANPAPAREAQPRKTNLLLSGDSVAALKRLKAIGYSYTFAIQRGLVMLETSLNQPGRGF